MKQLSELDLEKLGSKIKLYRVKKDMTQAELGNIIKVSPSTIGMYEQGRRQPPFDILLKISEVFGVDVSDFAPSLAYNSKNQTPGITRVPLLGTIAAGTPILAEENIADYFSIDDKIKADFALKIQGDSMIGAGIFPNDIVFIKQTCELENGEIGAILIEDSATLKKFYKENDTIILQAENDMYKPLIYTNGNIQILGKLVAVLNIRE